MLSPGNDGGNGVRRRAAGIMLRIYDDYVTARKGPRGAAAARSAAGRHPRSFPMHAHLANVVAIVIVAGIAVQWTAWRFRVPAIVLLTAAGFVLGPATGLVVPAQDFGSLLEPIVQLAVAVILFEGGLNLHFHELRARRQRRAAAGLARARAQFRARRLRRALRGRFVVAGRGRIRRHHRRHRADRDSCPCCARRACAPGPPRC